MWMLWLEADVSRFTLRRTYGNVHHWSNQVNIVTMCKHTKSDLRVCKHAFLCIKTGAVSVCLSVCQDCRSTTLSVLYIG
jgi:hypothetical protein